MPGYLVNGHQDALPIPGTDRTVTLKAAASFGDDLHCDAVAALLPAGTAERTHAYVLARTAVMIVAWDLVDAQGEPLPITPESLATLSIPVGGFLVAEARRRFEGRPEEEERPFKRRSRAPSEAAAPSAPT
jgi:hypothetical protein